ncbi:MAG: Chitin binding protein [Fibrobacteres bacterium]|nr:Chitin binding protein [Fibrobacterota bacterium]
MSMFKNVIGVFALAGMFASQAFSLAGTLTAANNNWTGTVEVTGAITVPPGLTLTIAPGTRVRATGTNLAITANGPVKASGTLANYIDFYGVGLVLNGAGSQHVLEYCVLMNNLTSAVWIAGADAKLNHVQIQDFGTNGVAITGAGSKVAMQYCTIGAKSRLFGGAEAVSVAISGGADAADVDISNSILGFENKPTQVGLSIKTAGGAAAASASVKVRYSIITGTRVGTGAGEVGILTGTDPDVKDIPNLDYHLWPYSAAINAGDPASDFSAEPAPNGGRVDMGYYGGTAEASPFQFRIVSPNGGDSLTPATTATIKWQGGKLLGVKKLDYSINNGTSWVAITSSADAGGTGSFAWTVPAVKSPNCLVRVSLPTGEGVDQSDRVFTIGDTTSGNSNGVLKDPTLFRCIPFTAYHDGQNPGGGEPTLAQVKADLELIKPLTREIRTYGSGMTTHGSKLPALCDQMGMKIHMGIWIDDTYTEAANQQSILEGIDLVNEGHASIKTVIVGNEFLLRVRAAHKDVGAAEAKLVRYIKQVKAAVPPGIVVGTGESYPDWLAASDELIKAVDRVIWHVHPWWEQKSADNAGNHAYNVYLQMKARIAKVPGGKPMVLGETGWPTEATTGAAVGSPENQARYLKDLHAWARKEGLDYWFFTNVDEKWKGNEGAVGAHWGMYNSDRTPKYIIGHLNELIPAATRWENDPVATAIRLRAQDRFALHGTGTSAANLSVYNLQGRLIGTLSGAAPAGENRLLEKTRKAAQGIILIGQRAR